MMNRVIKKIQLVILSIVIAGSLCAVAIPGAVSAAPDDETPTKEGCSDQLLTFPAWYKGVFDKKKCELKSPSDVGLQKFIFTVALNVLDILLQIVAYAAIGYIIFGGFKYMTQGDSPEGMTQARKTIQNAIIGLVIAIAAVAIVKLMTGVIAA